MSFLAAVPVKSFSAAKGRLSPLLDSPARSSLGRALAARTYDTVASSGMEAVILAGDMGVAEWAASSGWPSQLDLGGGLNGAAAAFVARAAGRQWLMVHADLPLLLPEDIVAAAEVLESGRSPIAPSDNGGTSLIGGRGQFSFAFGKTSFHRHIRRAKNPQALVRLGLLLDLDNPGDFVAAAAHPLGGWLRQFGLRPAEVASSSWAAK